MSVFRNPQVQTLSEWLEIATRGLIQASKKRIRVEIEAHYAEALEARREVGLSETDVQTKVLRELGDAKAAARRFRKQHLTEREDQRLKDSEKTGRSISWLILNYSLFAKIAYDQLPQRRNALTYHHHQSLGLGLEFLLMVALPTIRFAIAGFARTKPRRHLILYDPATCLVSGILLNGLLMTSISLVEVCLFGLVLLDYYLRHFRLWIKLRKTQAICSQTPPPDTAHV